MSPPSMVVSGTARYSLGEAFARAYLGRTPEATLIGIDRVSNRDLKQVPSFQELLFDLNPLHFPDGLRQFVELFTERLAAVVTTKGLKAINCLVHCAGVYDFGTFLEHNVARRERILGLNILGVTEVVHAVMELNYRLGTDNSKDFTYVLVGSLQGLRPRKGRPIYAPSKAYGVDLCTSLDDGREAANCIYIAPDLIDTPMLHRNHWVMKAMGSEQFFERILNAPTETYKSIFLSCDDATLECAAQDEFASDMRNLQMALARYRAVRAEASERIVKPEACAAAIADIVVADSSKPGVYVLTADDKAGKVKVKMAPFSEMDRRRIF
jgi:short-subunit dehydrogenase